MERRIGLRELARTIQASPSAVSRWEHGQHSPRGSVALRWAAALGLLERAAEIQTAAKIGAAREVESRASAKNDDAPGVEPGAPVEQSAPHASKRTGQLT